MHKIRALGLFLLLFYSSVALAEPYIISKVTDGDTLQYVTKGNKKHKIRLYGVDCPELTQAYGDIAKAFTRAYTLGQQVALDIAYNDYFGRQVALVTLDTAQNLQVLLLEAGLAWVDSRYCKQEFCETWRNLQRQAKLQKKGLWADKNPVAPWNWRKQKRKK